MKNYEEMSDLEINKLVAEQRGLLVADEDNSGYNYMRCDDDVFYACSTHKNDIAFLTNQVTSNEQ